MATRGLEADLKRSIRRGRVLTAPAQLAGYDADGLGYKTFRPDAVAIPANAEELIAVVRDARRLDIPVTIRGAGTSLSGGPVAAQGGLIVHTSALKSVRSISAAGFWCEAECSVTLSQLAAAVEPQGLFYPPDPSSGPVCTLGGNVAMNAGGAHCFRYGVTSNYVLGLEAVLLDGGVRRFGGPAGGRGAWREDWKRLMVGSEGTLAAFTRFWLRLLPRPEKAWTFRATYPDLVSAERAIHALVAHPACPVAIELMDPRCVAMVENSHMAVGLPKDAFLLVTEIDGPGGLVDSRVESIRGLLQQAGSLDVIFSDDPQLRQRLWKARKVAGGLMGQLSPDLVVQDAVIPKRALAKVLQTVYDEADAAGIPVVNVFHAGDGNLHPNFLFDSRQPGQLEQVEAISKRLMQRVIEVGGTLSGEHGIGNDKAAYMPLVFGETALRLQLAVPKVFNPRHQLNPLKVFTARRFGDGAEHGALAGRMEQPKQSGNARANQAERLFAPLIDPIDGVACVSALATAGQIDQLIRPHRLRFPLLLEPAASLREQVAASDYAPASSRFGPYCDNLLGMNWMLPGGAVVRIGERVVKSTTGYDLLRFLLGSRAALGEPLDFVVRLRPDCGASGVARLTGVSDAIDRCAAALLASCWLHWFDSVDVLLPGPSGEDQLRVAWNCAPGERAVYESRLCELAAEHKLRVTMEADAGPIADGLPDLVLKTTADQCLGLARQVVSNHPFQCVALCYSGVVHAYAAERCDVEGQVAAAASQFAARLHERGGDWRSRHCVSANALDSPGSIDERDVESRWLAILEQEFAAP
ncbi:MAG: FAD-binding protein [Pirellulaceae bacterium]|nr:FAD-binding protein [Pirellulaceae bacterium]